MTMPRGIPRQQLDRVLAQFAAHDPTRVALQLILDAGLCPRTVLRLRVGDVTIDGVTAQIAFVVGRVRHQATVTDPALVMALAAHLQAHCLDGPLFYEPRVRPEATKPAITDRPLTMTTLMARWRQACRAAQVKPALFHITVKAHADARRHPRSFTARLRDAHAWLVGERSQIQAASDQRMVEAHREALAIQRRQDMAA